MILLLSLLSLPAMAAEPTITAPVQTSTNYAELCVNSLKPMPGAYNEADLKVACQDAQVLEGCTSEKGAPIFHVNKNARPSETKPKRILVFSLIHGDEFPSGSVSRVWMERLTKIEPRNQWRIIPVLNPDGVAAKTRMNANGVDVNRNFPTKGWEEEALKYWEKKTKKDPRRFPGNKPGSEKETNCAIAHINDFQPDLILSVHTPYGVLDFDGPKIPPPNFPHIPWKNLGNYPGSLGRYMWVDRSKPTLTIELMGANISKQLEKIDLLQDITGDIAIKSEKILSGVDKPVATKTPTAKKPVAEPKKK